MTLRRRVVRNACPGTRSASASRATVGASAFGVPTLGKANCATR
jgi:hypothetical protein